MLVDPLDACVRKMEAAGVPAAAIAAFADAHRRLASGEQGVVPEDGIEPLSGLTALDDLPDDPDAAAEALERTVVIKLNGGLGTSMGLTGPKSLLVVKEGLTFLDVTVRQVLALRARTGARLPLVLMHSFATRGPSLDLLGRYGELEVEGIPLDFVQSKVPKVDAATLAPVSWPADPDLEWAPPGHGDLYPSLLGSGMLRTLVDAGFETAFVSNIDNLGALLDPRLAAWFAASGAPFAMESTDRTPSDRKGGHLARRRTDGRLILRETAQVRPEDAAAFEDIDRHRWFNTNNLWLRLPAVLDLLERQGGVLGLPMIVNRKTVDPTDPSSPAVIQLESAMGAAVDVIEGATAVRVGRHRFAPVKTTDQLLGVRSDAFRLDDAFGLWLDPSRSAPPDVRLDPAHYRLVADFERRFPHGPPSLVACDRLAVAGDVTFGAGVVVEGDVTLTGPATVADGTVLTG